MVGFDVMPKTPSEGRQTGFFWTIKADGGLTEEEGVNIKAATNSGTSKWDAQICTTLFKANVNGPADFYVQTLIEGVKGQDGGLAGDSVIRSFSIIAENLGKHRRIKSEDP